MHYLGVPTTRAASLIVSNHTKVKRDPLYDGNAIMEKCAVVMRVAPTFMRFGSFQIFAKEDSQTSRAGPSYGMEDQMMPHMLEYVISNFYPEIEPKGTLVDKTSQMFDILIDRTANMVAHW